MSTALELIQSSMRLAGILASGETATADEAVDGLKSLNDILENWSLENLMVLQGNNEQFALTPGVSTYTIGPGGAFNTTRPIRIGLSFTRVNGSDFPLQQWGLDEYNAVSVKTVGAIPEQYVYINENPLGTIILYPVPQTASTLFLNTDSLLTFPVALATTLVFPPGYEKALRYTLATNLAPEYGVTVSPAVGAIATASKADIKRANKKRVVAAYDPTLMGEPGYAYWQRGY
jgi:hypothetical protein